MKKLKNECIVIFTVIMAYMFVMSGMSYHDGDPVAVICFYISLTYLVIFGVANGGRWHGSRKNVRK